MSHLPCTYKTAELSNGEVKCVTKSFPRHIIREDTVVIRPNYIGICRADIKEIISSRDIPADRGPLFGHEFVGSVVIAGTSTGYQEGELVTFNPNITPNRTTGFAEYVFVHGSTEQLQQSIIRVPEHSIIDSIWMPEPMACIIHAIQKLLALAELPSLEGKKVGIIGAGCSGIMFSMYAKHLQADVHMFNRGEIRRNFVMERKLLEASEVSALTEIESHQNSFDIVIAVSTIITPEILEYAANLAVDGGILHIYGGTRKGDAFLKTQVDIDNIRRCEQIEKTEYQGKALRISGAYGCYKDDYEESFRLHAKYPDAFALEKIVSEEVCFDDFSELIMGMASGKKDYPGKVVLRINF